MKKVSIIIPIYNIDKWLDKCIESVINQNFTVILVNENSIEQI